MHNLRLHTSWTKRRFTSITTSPLWAVVPPLLNSFVSKRKRGFSKWRLLSTVLAGWQLYRKFRGIMSIFPRVRRTRFGNEERAPAATI